MNETTATQLALEVAKSLIVEQMDQQYIRSNGLMVPVWDTPDGHVPPGYVWQAGVSDEENARAANKANPPVFRVRVVYDGEAWTARECVKNE